jgi:hypothetical protein
VDIACSPSSNCSADLLPTSTVTKTQINVRFWPIADKSPADPHGNTPSRSWCKIGTPIRYRRLTRREWQRIGYPNFSGETK